MKRRKDGTGRTGDLKYSRSDACPPVIGSLRAVNLGARRIGKGGRELDGAGRSAQDPEGRARRDFACTSR